MSWIAQATGAPFRPTADPNVLQSSGKEVRRTAGTWVCMVLFYRTLMDLMVF